MRCPFCRTLDTKRKGTTGTAPTGLTGVGKPLQRFWCHACRRSFTIARRTSSTRSRFSSDVVHQAVTDYVEGLGSYRMLARTYSRRLSRDVSRSALNAWVAAAGAAAMTPLEMSRRLAPPGWGGWVGIDGKRLRIGSGDEATLMVAVDQTSTDLIHARVVDHESGDVFATC